MYNIYIYVHNKPHILDVEQNNNSTKIHYMHSAPGQNGDHHPRDVHFPVRF